MKRIFFLIFIFVNVTTFSQTRKITIENAEIQYAEKDKYDGATVLLGDVKINHDGIQLTCQKAFYFKDKNFFKAIGNVLIKQGDTITQTSDYVDYDANSKQALSWGNVVLPSFLFDK